jgi:predicted RNase H-like HicB family nuclease
MIFAVRLVPERKEGRYSVVVPGLPGCCSQGRSREEALENIRDAISLYLSVAQEMAEVCG